MHIAFVLHDACSALWAAGKALYKFPLLLLSTVKHLLAKKTQYRVTKNCFNQEDEISSNEKLPSLIILVFVTPIQLLLLQS